MQISKKDKNECKGEEYWAYVVSSRSLSPYPKKGSTLWAKIIKNRYLYILIIPALVLTIIFNYLPMYGAILAFKNFEFGKSFSSFNFVGLDNFTYLFVQADFLRAFRNTVIIGFCKFAIGFMPPIILALMLNELKSAWYKKLYNLCFICLIFFLG